MSGLLIKAIDHSVADPVEDRLGSYKAGMPVQVLTDAQVIKWAKGDFGNMQFPKFAVIHFPHVAADKLAKYVEPQMSSLPLVEPEVYRLRNWIIRWADLPSSVRQKFTDSNGLMIIKAGTWGGDYDYEWWQVKGFFRNQATGLDETVDI